MHKEIAKEDKKKIVIDLDKIVKLAKDNYPKNEKGAARFNTGSSIIRPNSDEDFVVWSKNSFWKDLTNLKGLPLGKVVQISGKPDSGKSSCALQFMVDAQKQGLLVVLWDAEGKFSDFRFEKMGGDPSQLLVVDTNSIVDGAKGVAHLVNTVKEQYPKQKILIVWDSVGSSINSSENHEDDEDFSKQPGVDAREIGWAVKKFNKLINKYANRETGEHTIGTLVINQTYANIGSVGMVERGGSQLEYLSSVIVQLTRKQDLTRVKNGNKYKYGILTRCKVKKNHLFNAEESLHELEGVVAADGVYPAKDVKSREDIQGWNDSEED